ncbi:DUF2202 domain-containing protein [Sulfurovum sp.]|uniref:DUF2202 domain-containing protein n=1 Tax=Sulfurovum sp. TaxID=1969726 RepID=UPI002A36EA56|nr:DUF2202 domain-containing protein [Sulfurovum sp.]MDY0403664.1 DUF2202 domain-containing protein [Sulfurovum sp.]
MEVNNRRNFLSKVMMTGIGGAALLSTSVYAKGPRNGSSTQTLTEAQKDKLFFIYQEEKVARDVYITLGNIYTDENTFASIQISEQRHMDAARGLCEKYGVDISGVDESQVGEFVLPVLQELYDTCVATGEESRLDALKIGELIELTDIDDLEEAAKGMPSDVVNVFDNLKEGSYNHLDAFRTAISRA